MKILQVSNYVSHHQLPIARSLLKHTGENNFRFAATQPLSAERRKMGWGDKENDPWILRAGENETDRDDFEKWWHDADVVICGERLFKRMRTRLADGKLTFQFSERWWKPPLGKLRLLHPRFAFMAVQFMKVAASPYFHFLPVGVYSAADIKLLASLEGKVWQWAYFPALPTPLTPCANRKKGLRILWAGRMLRWKRVDTLVRGFARLLRDRPDAELTLVGDGPERERLENLAAQSLPDGTYSFSTPVPSAEVRRLMREHHVYVLPSGGGEGWGGVVNEAMGEGCALIACEAAGAPRTLIRHGENGLLFSTGDWKTLGCLLCRVGNDEALRLSMAMAGQRSIAEKWSPATAADRLFQICDAILSGRTVPNYEDGAMAPVLT